MTRIEFGGQVAIVTGALPAVRPSTRPDQSRVVCGDGGLQAITDAQFRQHALHVTLHGGLREVELRRWCTRRSR